MSDSSDNTLPDFHSGNDGIVTTGGSSSLAIVVDQIRTSIPESDRFYGMFSGFQWHTLKSKLERAGINFRDCQILTLDNIASLKPTNLIVGLGEAVLRHFTDKKGIDKWHLSPLTTHSGQKFIPTFDLGRIQTQYELNLYMELAFRRAKSESPSLHYSFSPERFRLNPNLEETFATLDFIAKSAPEISVDVETGWGQVNTVGFAWSASDAIAINVLPGNFKDDKVYYELWRRIAQVLRADSRKVFQNFIYDVSYFSAHGIAVNNISWDTMWAMKFLYPELDMNLGNVGRIYTNRIYWKDDGKVAHEEGKKKDWGNIRDWHKHYLYNCRDTTGTLDAKRNQLVDLTERGLLSVWNDYVIKLAEPVLEMSSNGIPLSLERRESLRAEVTARINTLTQDIDRAVGFELNPGSSKQKLEYLRANGVTIPKKYNKVKKSYAESADASSLAKVALKHPELPAIPMLIQVATLQKALSSYIDFHVKEGESKCRFSLGKFTETFRFASGKDPWGRGINIQTIPREGGDVSIKSMFVAPEGYSFVEVDLRQAESRFVAYDANERTLIDMLESDDDVHTYVARAIINILGKDVESMPKEEFKKTWRQLGKKSGHGFNYRMKAGVFVDTVFAEMDLILPKKDAELIRTAYYDLFPGIPRWHEHIISELETKRKLTTPYGWERYFYGRSGDDMYKEGIAFRPQATIPYVTNQLMLYLMNERNHGKLKFHLVLQGHDSLYSLVPRGEEELYMRTCHRLADWQRGFDLPGGKLIIPVESKWGPSLDNTEEFCP